MSYGGMIAQGVGSELQGDAAYYAKMAVWDQYQKELQRAAKWQGQATDVLNQRIAGAGVDTANQEREQGAAARENAYANAAATPLAMPAANTGSTSAARDQAYASLIGGQRANLGGYSDWGLQQAIQNLNTQRALRAIEDTAGGYTQNVYPYNVYDAQHAYDALAGAGAFIGGLGNASSYFQAQAGQQQPGQMSAPGYANQVGDYGQGFGAPGQNQYAMGQNWNLGGGFYA